MSDIHPSHILIGKFLAPHGLRGWIRVASYADPVEQLFNYPSWYLQEDDHRFVPVVLDEVEEDAKGFRVRLKNCPDRTAVDPFVGKTLWVPRAERPTLPEGSYYWDDLLQFSVENKEGVTIGVLIEWMTHAAHDVMVVAQANGEKTLIPFVKGNIVLSVDTVAKKILVDWS